MKAAAAGARSCAVAKYSSRSLARMVNIMAALSPKPLSSIIGQPSPSLGFTKHASKIMKQRLTIWAGEWEAWNSSLLSLCSVAILHGGGVRGLVGTKYHVCGITPTYPASCCGFAGSRTSFKGSVAILGGIRTQRLHVPIQ